MTHRIVPERYKEYGPHRSDPRRHNCPPAGCPRCWSTRFWALTCVSCAWSTGRVDGSDRAAFVAAHRAAAKHTSEGNSHD